MVSQFSCHLTDICTSTTLLTAEAARQSFSQSLFFLTDPVALKKAFTALMTSSPDAVSQQLNKLLERLREKESSGHDISDQCGELVMRLNSQFPGDVGCFCIYFLNHIVLQPGEAMFLGPNLPHAYLAGGKINPTVNLVFICTLHCSAFHYFYLVISFLNYNIS